MARIVAKSELAKLKLQVISNVRTAMSRGDVNPRAAKWIKKLLEQAHEEMVNMSE